MKVEVQQELMTIYEANKALNPEVVIEVARNKKSAMHDHFEWDDSAAAHQHRLEQARRLIRVAVTVIPELSNEPVKQFVSIMALRGSEQGSYIATADILSDKDKYEMAKRDALRALERLRFQYNYITELDLVWDAIADAIEKVREAA